LKTEFDLNEELLAKARELSGIDGRDELIQAALNALIERESARRLANLGGSEPQLRRNPRR
jgi:Bacterial antitoxin of type II TA system, VapB